MALQPKITFRQQHPEHQGGAVLLGGDLGSNTLGTALGDFLADDSGLGFMGGAALIGGLIGVVAVLSRLTRPFGATFGDLLTKRRAGWGSGPSARRLFSA